MGRHRDHEIEEFVRRLVKHDAQVRVPRAPFLTPRQAIITRVDHSAAHCHLQLAGSLVELPTVPYVQSYSPVHLPQVGHTCWVHCNGPDMYILGQHVNPFAHVIP